MLRLVSEEATKDIWSAYLESRSFAAHCFADDDLGVVVFEDPQEADETRVIASLP